MPVPTEIVCVDCGGRAHLSSYPPPDEGFAVGNLITFRCEDCMDRWDLIVTDDDLDDNPDP